MNKIVSIALWVVFLVGMYLVMGFVSRKQETIELRSSSVDVSIQNDGEGFLDEDYLKERISNGLGYEIDSCDLDAVRLSEVERFVHKMDEVKSVEVYKTIDGVLKLNVEERKPLVRIIHKNGMSNYLDDEGEYMGLSSRYTAPVLVVTGVINESAMRDGVRFIEADKERSEKYLSDDVFELAAFIEADEFWKAQILQVHINEKREFELIPRVGEHRILLGTLRDMERKFKKLKVFYEEGLSRAGWNSFDTINLKYRNQIVCS